MEFSSLPVDGGDDGTWGPKLLTSLGELRDAANAAPAGITVDDLPSAGIVSAHHSGGPTDAASCPVAGDGSISGMYTAMGMGAHILDLDYRATADGTLVVMHDTTVDRTTVGSGLVSEHVANALPNLAPSRYVGTGWPDERVPTLKEVLARFGRKVVLTMEAKGGVSDVKPLADLLKAHGLTDCVFINTNSVATVSEIVAQGCLAHMFTGADSTLITPGIAAGASLIEVPYNASAAIVAQCQAAVADPTKKLRWFIAGPISTRTQAKALTPGIMGHVSDALGMTNRVTGDGPLVSTIKPSLLANKRGLGWKTAGSVSFDQKGIVNKSAGTDSAIYVGGMSGTMPGTYTLRMKIVPSASLVGTTNSIRARVAATTPDQDAQDATTDGYVCALRGNGAMSMWVSNASFGAGVLLGSSTGDPALVAGTEYSVRIDVTPTTIKMTREDTGTAIGPYTNSTFRGGNHYLWFWGGTDSRISDFTRS